jgi:transposase-like protein
MQRRNWDAKTKAKIVLEGLSGRPVAELCGAYQISQHQYYQWREKFTSQAHQAFEAGRNGGEVQRLRQQTAR